MKAAAIPIEGSRPAAAAIGAALALIDAAGWGDRVAPYVGLIRAVAAGSGMRAYDSPPTYTIGAATWSAGVAWCASTIAHDAHHSRLYHEWIDAHDGEPVPDHVWTGREAERQCLAVQREFVAALAAARLAADAPALLAHLDRLVRTDDPYERRGRYWSPSR